MAFVGASTNINGGTGPFRFDGTPSAGTNAVFTLTIGGTPTGGTFKLAHGGFTTGAITWSATNATLLANIQAALDALPSLGSSGLTAAAGTLTSGIGTITLTAGGNVARSALAAPSVADNALTGTNPTLALATTTAGERATYRGASPGASLVSATTGKHYTNTGTALAPVWTVTGTQS